MNAPVIRVRNGQYYLCDFDAMMASQIATWARDAHELFWLAPSTPPPLTASKVISWLTPDVSAFLFRRDQVAKALGYFELNLMPAQNDHLWLGHCVIAPDYRGCGLGTCMVSLAIEDAFIRRKAESVSLVVFPDNLAAVACYRSVGFVTVGEQIKEFRTAQRPHRMLRMSIARRQYLLSRGLSQAE